MNRHRYAQPFFLYRHPESASGLDCFSSTVILNQHVGLDCFPSTVILNRHVGLIVRNEGSS
jgi:hypothetical protein